MFLNGHLCLWSAIKLFFRTFAPFASDGLIFVPMLPFCSLRQPPERHQTEDLARLSPSLYNLSFMSTCACEQFLGSAIRDPQLTVSRGVRHLRVDSQILVSRKFWCCHEFSLNRLSFTICSNTGNRNENFDQCWFPWMSWAPGCSLFSWIFIFVLPRFSRTDVFERSFAVKHLTMFRLFGVHLSTRRAEKKE